VIESPEECEVGFLEGATCESLGYATGTLQCADCRFDLARCAWLEDCRDGVDNDADGDVDCLDADCLDACADACADPTPLADGEMLIGDTTGHGNTLDAACGAGAGLSGPELAYRFVAEQDGVVEVSLRSNAADLTLSLRDGCDAGAAELACSADGFVSAAVSAGDELFVVVDGAASAEAGPFVLELAARAVACGDRVRDPGEECEDGGTESGDGCHEDCTLESSEGPDNGTPAGADPLVSPYFAQVDPQFDVDWVRVELATGDRRITAMTRGFLGEDCANGALDTYLELYDATGTTLLASNNDAASACSTLVVQPLDPGTYLVRIFGGDDQTPVFPYVLEVVVD